MKTTPIYLIPYPESGDHTRTWEYWQGMAERLETVLGTLARPKIWTAKLQLAAQNNWASFTAKGVATVVFPVGFFSAVPTCVISIDGNPSQSTQVMPILGNVTAANVPVRFYNIGAATINFAASTWSLVAIETTAAPVAIP